MEKLTRLQSLIAKARVAGAQPFGTKDRMRQWRAIEVLEKIGSLDAKQHIRELANGAAGTRLTTAARAALTRLDGRANVPK